jgi:hypothetical protein
MAHVDDRARRFSIMTHSPRLRRIALPPTGLNAHGGEIFAPDYTAKRDTSKIVVLYYDTLRQGFLAGGFADGCLVPPVIVNQPDIFFASFDTRSYAPLWARV